jgi:hypothetical protein
MISFVSGSAAVGVRQPCFYREFVLFFEHTALPRSRQQPNPAVHPAPQRDMCRLMASGMVFRTTSWSCWLNDSSRDDGVAS